MKTRPNVVLRELVSVAELKASEHLQRAVWGDDDPADNSDLMLAIQHEGGLVAGAFTGLRMLGFLFAFPTARPDVQHSHRLAVHPDSQGLGLGTRLKWFQRDWCLQRRIHTVRWTYDPVRSVNAVLNIARLGATTNVLYENYYGEMQGINASVPSDRILAEWHLMDRHVQLLAQGFGAAHPKERIVRRVSIPRDFAALVINDLGSAVAERLRVRRELMTAFDEGLRIIGFDTPSCQYLLSGGGGAGVDRSHAETDQSQAITTDCPEKVDKPPDTCADV